VHEQLNPENGSQKRTDLKKRHITAKNISENDQENIQRCMVIEPKRMR
jgi:hypothetical protein